MLGSLQTMTTNGRGLCRHAYEQLDIETSGAPKTATAFLLLSGLSLNWSEECSGEIVSQADTDGTESHCPGYVERPLILDQGSHAALWWMRVLGE